MVKTNSSSMIWEYLKGHRKGLILFLLAVVIFTVIFSLYDIPGEAVGYAALLFLVFVIIFAVLDFIGFCKKHSAYMEVNNNIAFSLEGLPPPSNLQEQDYQELLHHLQDEKNRVAVEMEQMKDDMTDYYTLWAHQIKTPISAASLLLQSEEKAEKEELLTELFKIEQYVDMVLTYLRAESMASDMVLKKCDLDEIVKQTLKKYAKVFIRKKLQLDYQPLHYQVLSDKKWLLFVIEQVLSNALKYTNEGKISIYMVENTLVIEDTGIGIKTEDLYRIFEKGYTGYNGRIDQKSTGIGLYLCKRILNHLSHEITIDSDAGKGSRAMLTFYHETLYFD